VTRAALTARSLRNVKRLHRTLRLVGSSLWLALGMIVCSPTVAAGNETALRVRGPAPLELVRSAAPASWQRQKVDSQGSSWPQTNWAGYNTLTTLATPPGNGAIHLITPIEGDAAKGRQLAFDRTRGGSCVACHVMGKDTPPQPGNVGPDLSLVGATRSDEWLFNYVYDPRTFNPGSIMPPWGAHRLFNIVEIRDIVAFLKTLKVLHTFGDAQENPGLRTPPKETRDNLDPTENPAMFALDRGKELFVRASAQGKSCASCHAAPESTMKSWAAQMPRYEARLNKVLGVEEFITRHARATTGAELPMQEADNVALSVYLHHLSNGAVIRPDLSSPGARKAAASGRALMQRKLGQLNMACVDCHTREKHAFKWARGQYLVESRGTIAHFPTWRTSRGDIWDIRKRFQWCNVSVRANDLPPDAREYGDIEMALAEINKGEKISSPGIRH
jgi:sulfur-oxidizing protein SoxA